MTQCDACNEERSVRRVKGTKFWLCQECRDKQGLGVLAVIQRDTGYWGVRKDYRSPG